MPGIWRLIVHPPSDGPWNMAVDETLLRSCASSGGDSLPVLRLYGWSPAALSLGRAQPSEGAHDPTYLRREAIDLVRRPTGGGAVLHEHERTYAIVARAGRPFGGTLRETYAAIGSALQEAYRLLGVRVETSKSTAGDSRSRRRRQPLCFARPSRDEIVVEGRKLAGSAQLRTRGAFLQHGSLLLRADGHRLERATGARADSGALGDIESAVGREVRPRAVDDALAAAFETVFGIRFAASRLTDGERLHATRLRAWKYLSSAWTLLGRDGSRAKREQAYGGRTAKARRSVAQ